MKQAFWGTQWTIYLTFKWLNITLTLSDYQRRIDFEIAKEIMWGKNRWEKL